MFPDAQCLCLFKLSAQLVGCCLQSGRSHVLLFQGICSTGCCPYSDSPSASVVHIPPPQCPPLLGSCNFISLTTYLFLYVPLIPRPCLFAHHDHFPYSTSASSSLSPSLLPSDLNLFTIFFSPTSAFSGSDSQGSSNGMMGW